jgi:DNA-binding IclR family transcriptional regulator
MPKQRNVLKSADKLFTMLEYLKESDGKTVTELSAELNMPKSTVQVYLNTLYDHNFVAKNDGTYEVGLRFLEFGMFSLWNEPVFPEVKPKVEELAESTGELAACFVGEEGEAVYVYGTEGERSIRTNLSVGDRSPLHCTASGKAILAHLSDERIRRIIEDRGLEAKTPNTITDADDLFVEVADIREQGYAVSMEESVEGVRAVAAPVLLDDTVVASVSLAGPANRFVGERLEKRIPETVKGAANELELKLTYSQSGI